MNQGYLLEALGTNGTSIIEETYIIDTIEGAKKAMELAKKDFENKGNKFIDWNILHCIEYGNLEEILEIMAEDKTLSEKQIESRLEAMGYKDPFEKDCHILNTMMSYGHIVYNEHTEQYFVTNKGKAVNELIKRGGSFATESAPVC